MDWLLLLGVFLIYGAWLPVSIYLLIFKGENGALVASTMGLAYVLFFYFGDSGSSRDFHNPFS